MTTGDSSGAPAAGRAGVEVSISIPTILLVAGAVAIAWALASIANVLLMILVSIFSAAVLVPVVSVMERRLRWSRRLCSFVLVLAVVVVIGAVLLVVAQAISDAVRDFSDDLPQIVDRVRHSELGAFINEGSGSLDTLREHAGDITRGVETVSGGVADVGVSAFGAVTLVFSVTFLTLFGVIDAPHARDWIGSLLYRDRRDRYLRVADRIIHTTSRYMLGNIAISLVCGTVYGVTAVILDMPYPLALALIAGFLDLIPNIGATIAGFIAGIVALSVSVEALIAFAIVMVVYQQIENYVLQPTIIGKAARISGFTVLASVLAFGALFGLIGAFIAVPIAAGLQIVIEELTAARRARIATADAAEQRHDQREASRASARDLHHRLATTRRAGPVIVAPASRFRHEAIGSGIRTELVSRGVSTYTSRTGFNTHNKAYMGGRTMARVTRRRFLKVSGAGALAAKAGGMAGILATSRAPAYAQATTVHWLRWADFVPASDQLFR